MVKQTNKQTYTSNSAHETNHIKKQNNQTIHTTQAQAQTQRAAHKTYNRPANAQYRPRKHRTRKESYERQASWIGVLCCLLLTSRHTQHEMLAIGLLTVAPFTSHPPPPCLFSFMTAPLLFSFFLFLFGDPSPPLVSSDVFLFCLSLSVFRFVCVCVFAQRVRESKCAQARA